MEEKEYMFYDVTSYFMSILKKQYSHKLKSKLVKYLKDTIHCTECGITAHARLSSDYIFISIDDDKKNPYNLFLKYDNYIDDYYKKEINKFCENFISCDDNKIRNILE